MQQKLTATSMNFVVAIIAYSRTEFMNYRPDSKSSRLKKLKLIVTLIEQEQTSIHLLNMGQKPRG